VIEYGQVINVSYFQILTCNNTLGTCCSDYGLVNILNIIHTVFVFIQIIVPILLLVMVVFQFTNLVINPDMKNGLKKVTNKFIAAVIIFLLPVFVDVLLNILPVSKSFQVATCWKSAKSSAEVLRSKRTVYIDPKTGKKKVNVLISPGQYKPGKDKKESSGNNKITGTARGKAIVDYAKSFVGKPYIYGGSWNGEIPYMGTDCSGFVQGVFKHFGINLTRTTDTQWADTASYKLVKPPQTIQAGDLVMYNGHVAILTGNGNEIVHAMSSDSGIVVSSDYRTNSNKAILGIMRINGVN